VLLQLGTPYPHPHSTIPCANATLHPTLRLTHVHQSGKALITVCDADAGPSRCRRRRRPPLQLRALLPIAMPRKVKEADRWTSLENVWGFSSADMCVGVADISQVGLMQRVSHFTSGMARTCCTAERV
jgi:hypothetical protein